MPATIYKITHPVSGRCYVGHTTAKVTRRWSEHRNKLRRGKHHSPPMQNAWTKYGEGAFVFEVIETCTDDQKLIREQHFMDTLDSAFNSMKKAATPGRPPEDTIAKLRERMKGNQYGKGRVHTPEEKERRAASGRGLKRSPEARARMSAGQRGKPRPASRGKPKSAEWRAKVSAANSKPRPHLAGIKRSPEVLARMSAAQKGKPHLKARGVPLSPERRAKISAAHLRRSAARAALVQ